MAVPSVREILTLGGIARTGGAGARTRKNRHSVSHGMTVIMFVARKSRNLQFLGGIASSLFVKNEFDICMN